MASNGEIVWGPWLTGVGRLGILFTAPAPTPGQSVVTGQWEVWFHSVPGYKVWHQSGFNTYDGAGALYATRFTGMQFHTIPGSGSEAVDVRVWVQAIDIPVAYAHLAPGYARIAASQYGKDDSDGMPQTAMEVTHWPAPVRPYDVPAAPTGLTASKVSESRVDLGWAIAPATSAPITNIYVERGSYTAGFSQIAVLGAVTGWSDLSIPLDNMYAYRIRAGNSAGYSAYSNIPTWLKFKPNAPYGLAASRSGNDVTLTWINSSSYSAAEPVRVMHREGTGAWSTLGSTAAGASTYTHVAATAGVTHSYKVLMVPAGGFTTSDESAVVTIALLNPPAAPLVTAPGVANVAGAGLPVTWVHNPLDATVQTNAQVRYRAVGAPAWTTVTVTTPTTYTVAAGVLPNGVTYEVQVATKGGHASYGPFSASQLVVASTPPVPAITAPAHSSTVSSGVLALTWTYYDAEGTAQSAWEARLKNSLGNIIAEAAGTSGTAYTFPSYLENDSAYSVELRVRDGSGLWSAWAVSAFATDFPEPVAPEVTLLWDAEVGAVVVNIVNPDTGEDVVSNQVFRSFTGEGDWVFLGDAVPNAGFVDRLPAVGSDNHYRIVALTEFGSSASEAAFIGPDHDVSRWAWFNTGPGFTKVARVRADSTLEQTYTRAKAMHYFDGPEFGKVYGGNTRVHALKYSGTAEIDKQYSTPDDMFAIQDDVGPACYRDYWNRLFVGVLSVTVGQPTAGLVKRKVEFTLERHEYAE